jgi:hypothetical protein
MELLILAKSCHCRSFRHRHPPQPKTGKQLQPTNRLAIIKYHVIPLVPRLASARFGISGNNFSLLPSPSILVDLLAASFAHSSP